jgi:hypothetical protein
MNEVQRQTYLTAMGVDTYMPRWILPNSPESFLCETGLYESNLFNDSSTGASYSAETNSNTDFSYKESSVVGSSLISNALSELIQDIGSSVNSSKSVKNNTAEITSNIPINDSVSPFTLSIWRPTEGLLVIDSRDKGLVLPTELLLNNVLRFYLSRKPYVLDEDVLRWPMIENRFTSRSYVNAQQELQTWLQVENELRPAQKIWLMGEDAQRYLFEREESLAMYSQKTLLDDSVTVYLMPSLSELLHSPSLKTKLFQFLCA